MAALGAGRRYRVSATVERRLDRLGVSLRMELPAEACDDPVMLTWPARRTSGDGACGAASGRENRGSCCPRPHGRDSLASHSWRMYPRRRQTATSVNMAKRVLLADGRIDEKTFRTIPDAVRGAQQHPRHQLAQAQSRDLAGSTFVDAAWTDVECRVLLSGDRTLHIGLDGGMVVWSIETGAPWPPPNTQVRDQVDLEYRAPDGGIVLSYAWNPTALISRRLGRRVSQISAGTAFFYLYIEDTRILLFMRVREFGTGRSMLAWDETD